MKIYCCIRCVTMKFKERENERKRSSISNRSSILLPFASRLFVFSSILVHLVIVCLVLFSSLFLLLPPPSTSSFVTLVFFFFFLFFFFISFRFSSSQQKISSARCHIGCANLFRNVVQNSSDHIIRNLINIRLTDVVRVHHFAFSFSSILFLFRFIERDEENSFHFFRLL